MKLRRESGKNRWILWYTAIYLIGMCGIGLVLLRYDKTLIWVPDGIKQPYTAIGYVGQMVRRLLAGEGYRMVDFSLGQGFDVITTMTYYGYTDPLSLLGTFFSGDGIETCYMIIDFLRVYLAGLFCGLYLRKMKIEDQWALAAGCSIYVFSGFSVWMMGRHPYFMNGAMYLPLLLVGIERIFENRKWLMFTLITALMLVVNFYFAFMNTVTAILYILVRLVVDIRENGVKESAKDGFMLLGCYLLGAALAGIVFLPVAQLYLASSRIGVESGYRASMLHYKMSHYIDMFVEMFAACKFPSFYTFTSYLPMALFGLLALIFVKKRQARMVFGSILVCLVGACIPAVGYVMNGTAYVSNRWMYIMAMFMAFGSAIGISELFKPETTFRRKIVVAALVYTVALVLLAAKKFVVKKSLLRAWPVWIAVMLIVGFALILLVYDRRWFKKLTDRGMRVIMCVFLAFSSLVYSAAVYLPSGAGYIKDQMDTGIWESLTNETAAYEIEDDSVYRVSHGEYCDAHAPLLDYMGTGFYWSLVDGEVGVYYANLGLPMQRMSYNVLTIGGSSAMNTVAAVKYFVINEGQNGIVPYGFEKVDTLTLSDGTEEYIYENRYALPMGYAYDEVMSREEYDALPVEDKLQALTQYAICDGAVLERKGAFQSNDKAHAFTMTADENVDVSTPGRISAKKGGALKLEFEAMPDGETYLIIDNFKMEKKCGVVVRSKSGVIQGELQPSGSNFYFEKPCMAFCLGSDDIDSCEISFSRAGRFTYDDIRIVSVSLETYRASTQARQAESMENVMISNNALSGDIRVRGDRVLQIAVPYSSGWMVLVDGEVQEAFRCGGMYTGVELKAGQHHIEMHYVTPGLKSGAILSALALVVILALVIWDRKRKKGTVKRI